MSSKQGTLWDCTGATEPGQISTQHENAASATVSAQNAVAGQPERSNALPYLAFSADHDEERARRRFVQRFGYAPAQVERWGDGRLRVGPVEG